MRPVLSVLMPALAMYMLVSDFLGRCRAHVHHFDDKAQGFATQRVINNKGVLKKPSKEGFSLHQTWALFSPSPRHISA